MRRRGGAVRGVVLLVALVLSGCVSFGAPVEAPRVVADAPRGEAAGVPVLAAAPPDPDPTPRLAAALRFPEVWLRPLQDQVGLLDAPGATKVHWYVGVEGVHPSVRFIAGHPYVTAEPGRASEHPATTGPVEPGRAGAMRLVERGRHALGVPGHPGASFALSVVADAPEAASVTAFLVEEGGAVRFLPERLSVRPGTRVVFLNQATAAVEVARTAFQPWVGAGPGPLNVTPVDEGTYTLVAEVSDDVGARGEARGRFLVDFDRPALRREVGPIEGSFRTGDLAPALPPQEARERFEAEFPVTLLRLAANATSLLPGPAAVRVQLLRAEVLVGEFVTGEAEGLTLLDLPPGPYVVRITPESGHDVWYEATARMSYRLPVPPALREG
jgi:plastocyanin